MNPETRGTLSRNRDRVSTIVGTLAEYGLARWLPSFLPAKGTHTRDDVKDLPMEVRLRMALSDLGPVFVKLGQMLSTRGDLVGPEAARELSQLRTDVPADDPDVVVAAVEAELGMTIADAYAEFDATAMASGSIGQAHNARLRDGTSVIVKVLHDGIEDLVEQDTEILEALAQLAEDHNKDARELNVLDLTRSFNLGLRRELDFGVERANMTHFGDRYNDAGSAYFPMAYPDRSGRRVLTMEYLEGPTLDESDRVAEVADVDELVECMADTYIDMILDDGVFHGDPHPGNMVAMPDGRLGFLDSGLVGKVDDQMKYDMVDLVVAARRRDARRVSILFLRLGSAPASLDREAYEKDVDRWMDEFLDASLEELDMGRLVEASMELARKHHITLSNDVSLLGKVLAELEGTIEDVGSDLQFDELLESRSSKLIELQFSPQRIVSEMQHHAEDWADLIDALPRDTLALLRQMTAGTLTVGARIVGLDAVTNRVVYGLMIAALFLGSSFLLAFDVPPLVGDLSLLGLIGWIIGLGLFVSVMRAIRRRGGL